MWSDRNKFLAITRRRILIVFYDDICEKWFKRFSAGLPRSLHTSWILEYKFNIALNINHYLSENKLTMNSIILKYNLTIVRLTQRWLVWYARKVKRYCMLPLNCHMDANMGDKWRIAFFACRFTIKTTARSCSGAVWHTNQLTLKCMFYIHTPTCFPTLGIHRDVMLSALFKVSKTLARIAIKGKI